MKKSILQNKLKPEWRKYSPGGKRRKVTNIPFMGQVSDISAMGTKRVGVLSNKFSYAQELAEFAVLPASAYPPEAFKRLSPEEQREAIRAEQSIRDRKEAKAAYNTTINTAKEGRGWVNTVRGTSAEVRGWMKLLGGNS